MILVRAIRFGLMAAAVCATMAWTTQGQEPGSKPETMAPQATGSSVRAIERSFAGSLLAQVEPAGPLPETMAPAPTGSTAFNGIAHIAVRVKDIAASVAFYNKLGFEQAFAMTGKDGSVSQSFIKLNDKQFIELYPVTAANPQIGFLHLCFEGQDLNAIYADYVARGLTPNIAVRKAGAGNLLFTMKGPLQFAEPQNIEYTQYMPGSLHTKDIGNHLGADRVAVKMVSVTLAVQDPAAAKAFYTDKLKFAPVTGRAGYFALPGSSGEMVEIVGLEPLGAKSSIEMMSSFKMDKVEAMLKAKGVAVMKEKGAVKVVDPDGNAIRVTMALD